jgi:hypothetical protein
VQRCHRIGFERQARRAEIEGDLLIALGTLCAASVLLLAMLF